MRKSGGSYAQIGGRLCAKKIFWPLKTSHIKCFTFIDLTNTNNTNNMCICAPLIPRNAILNQLPQRLHFSTVEALTQGDDFMHTFENVPDELRSLPNWVIWGISDSRPKIPYSPRTTTPAEADNPSTWGTFEEAVMIVERKGCGIGFEFGAPEGYAGIDIDHCVQSDGTLSDMAAEIVRIMDSYTEYSACILYSG